ncbi:ABC-2 type transport system permease protein [Saccharothrix tamanrassetensis]|uniref:ABC-2 type transport system permease protein n=1 Tax=Saccharothrix tamanrassetensis TaxID=1051531 RepID=A0A841CDF6_9PSEU|nr:ABC-2 family transporter protein [Saccharothrix tamanrassetensis]MBB5954993.1 ABC-2 type transport system permease protein [Saccharothrix tamanrassetensis]
MFAGLAANVMFGLLRTAVMIAVVGAAPVAGYDVPAAVAYVWLGQGLLAFVQLWGDARLAGRIRTGDVVVDLYRPWHLQAALFAEDVGRAGFSLFVRLVPPVLVGALLFPFQWPEVAAWPLFAVSALLALVVSFGLRFLVNATAFWLLDSRGVESFHVVATSAFCGLGVPLSFFPDWAQDVLWATPFPAIIQAPIDVYLSHDPQWTALGHQLFWAVVLSVAGHLVLQRAVRKVVVQGG